MKQTIADFTVWLGSTALSNALVDSPWIFPTAEIGHFIGLTMLFGFVAAIDLRMLGFAKRVPLAALHRLLPWGAAGFALTALTGCVFIIAASEQYLPNGVFWYKMLFVVLAGANVLAFYLGGIYRRVDELGPGEDAPGSAKAIAAVSLVLWIGVIFWGRMLAFLGIAF